MTDLPINLTTFPLTNEPLVPKITPSDVSDHLQTMKQQENTTYRCGDYIHKEHFNTQMSLLENNETENKMTMKPINKRCRSKMVYWCYQVAGFCSYRRETVGIGMSLLDRYLSKPSSDFSRRVLFDRKSYQLAAMTTFYIAIKIHEPVIMDSKLLSELSRGCHSVDDIEEMERDILGALNWNISGPTPIEFVRHFLTLFPKSVDPVITSTILDFAQYQTELAVSEYKFVTVRPSVIALASMLNAMDGIDAVHFKKFSKTPNEFFLQLVTDLYGKIDPIHLHEARVELLQLFLQSVGNKLKEIVAPQLLSNIADSKQGRKDDVSCCKVQEGNIIEMTEEHMNIEDKQRRRRSSKSPVSVTRF